MNPQKNQKEWPWHLLAWTTVILFFSLRDLAFHPIFWQNIFTNFLVCLIASVPVYVNLYWLMPKFLYHKKYVAYLAALLPFVVPAGWAAAYMLHHFIGIPFYGLVPGQMQMVAEILLLTGMATTAKAVKQWQQKQRDMQELEKRSLEQELQALRNQVNPHFMFNTLNNIYVMIRHDAPTARDMVMRFSQLLSHQLYDSSKKEVRVEQEAQYLKNYIELEKIRQGEAVEIRAELLEKSDLKVAPLLFLPLVENAFKHGFAAGMEVYQLSVVLQEQDGGLYFSCGNDYQPGKTGKKGGIGLENVRKRLELLYPDRHRFHLHDDGKKFTVEITLQALPSEQQQEQPTEKIQQSI